MAFIAFLGCDGSGKSAVIEGTMEHLQSEGISVVNGHWRPVAFSSEKSEVSAHNADDPHGQIPRGKICSIAKLAWIWLNWWTGWIRVLRAKSSKGVVIFDRYHADLLVDPTRYRYGGPAFLARLVSLCMPQPDRVFFLDAPVEVLLQRKQEVSKEALEHSRMRYLQLVETHSRFKIIDARRSLPEVVDDVISIITGDHSLPKKQ